MAMTKAQIVAALADKVGVSKKESGAMLEALAQLAYAEAANGFTIPGLGKLVVVDRKARLGRNPKTGETIQIPAKKALKFRVAKAAKDAAGDDGGSKNGAPPADEGSKASPPPPPRRKKKRSGRRR